MKQEYIITNEELSERYGLDLSRYALDTTFIPLIINIALGKAITRILYLNDNFEYEKDIVKVLDDDENLIDPFKKLQFQIIYNLIFLGDNDPIDSQVDDIICSDLRLGKVNGWQKHIYHR